MATAEFNSRNETAQPVSLESLSDSLVFGVTFAIALTIIQRGVGFLRGLLFCQLMTEQELGQWSMAYSFLMLLAPLAVLGLPGSFGRFVEHYRQKGQLSSFICRIAWVSGFLTLGFAVAMLVFAKQFSGQIFGSEKFVGIVQVMAVALLFVTANNFLSTLMESLRQVRRATLMRFNTGIAFAIFGTSLIWFGDNGTWAATFGFGMACLIGMYPAVSFLIRHRNKIIDTGQPLTHQKMWIRIVPFALWLWASNFVTNMFEVSDRYMLIHWSSSDVDSVHAFLGQYHSGRILPTLLVGVSAILVGMLLPFLSAHWEKQKHDEAKRLMNLATKLMSIAFTAAGIAMVCFANVLFDVAFAGKFDEGLAVLPATSLYCIWFSLIGLLTTYLLVIEKGKQMFCIIGAGLVLNLILNMLLIPILGLQGAVMATTISMFLTLIVSFGMNSWQGLPIERSVIACAILPVAVVAPVQLAILIFVSFIAIAITTGLIFNKLEKAAFRAKVDSLKQRVFGKDPFNRGS